MSKLSIFGDMMSQPTRAVIAFCKLAKIPFDFENVNLTKREQFSETYKKINPHSLVPAIRVIDSNKKEFKLYESHAIIRFLSVYFLVDEKWYPRQDLYRRGLVDQYLDYHHLNTRFVFANKFFRTFFGPLLEKKGRKLKAWGYDVDERIPVILSYFDSLLGKQKFIVDDQISAADILFTCEANQLQLIRFDLSSYKNLTNYMNTINAMPEMVEVNEILVKLTKKIYNEETPNAKF